MNRNEKEHEITDREKRAWKDGAKPRKRDRPQLTTSQRIVFLKLVAQLASNSTFERKLGLDSSDVEFYKKQFEVENQDDARRLCKRLEIAQLEGSEEMIISEMNKARAAEAVANVRLKELELRRVMDKREKTPAGLDANKVRAEDAERQKRFKKDQNKQEQDALDKSDPWHLPLEGSEFDRRGIVDRFRKDIENCGLVFCCNKYQASPIQIKAEAIRLGIRINWDSVKR